MAVVIRRNDIRASNVLFLCVAIAGIRQLLWQVTNHISPYFPQWAVAAVVIFTLGIYVGLGFGIRAGKRWAKVLFLLYSLLNFSFTTLPTLNTSALLADSFLSVLAIGLQIWAFFLVARDQLRRPTVEEAG